MFFNPRKNKYKWASIVMSGAQPGMHFDEKILEEATDVYIKQHERIFYESVQIAQTTKDADIKKERYKLAISHYGSLAKVYRYASKEQKGVIDCAEKRYFQMESQYKHLDGQGINVKAKRKAKKDAFWEVYGEAEALDIFSGKKK